MKMFFRVVVFVIAGYTPSFYICVRPLRMANPSQRHPDLSEKGKVRVDTELKNMNQSQGQSSGATRMALPDTVCKPIHCHEARQRHHPPDLAGSPWHVKKTIFLIALIVLLVVWAIVYGLLKKFDII